MFDWTLYFLKGKRNPKSFIALLAEKPIEPIRMVSAFSARGRKLLFLRKKDFHGKQKPVAV